MTLKPYCPFVLELFLRNELSKPITMHSTGALFDLWFRFHQWPHLSYRNFTVHLKAQLLNF